MKTRSAPQLKTALEHLSALLEEESLFSVSRAEKDAAIGQTHALLTELTAIEGRSLAIGLLGGTGVGKSSLMNALAGSKIASTSHRRPHTDRVLIYRYQTADPLPEAALAHIPSHEVIHQSSRIKDILLCDLPDFDSLAHEHRERVLGFLKQLDLLIWVTSPEKYADSSLYEFIQVTAKACQNFYFVLNKADLFFEGRSTDQGHKELAAVMQGFSGHIRAQGIEEPLIYTVSAREAMEASSLSPWNQFSTFSHQIFQQRDAKKITAIKSANLDVEAGRLFSLLKREVSNLQRFEKLLRNMTAELKAQRSSWTRTGKEAIELWLDRHAPRDIVPYSTDSANLVGPGHGVGRLLDRLGKSASHDRGQPMALSDLTPPDDVALRFQKRLERVEDRITGRLLSEDLPSPFRDRLQRIVDARKNHEELGERFFDGVALGSGQDRPDRMWGFRAVQYILYTVLFMLFLLALGGENGWQGVTSDPGASTMVGLITAMVHTLFSPKGLAALVTFGALNLFLGFRFYRRYTRTLDRKARRRVRALKAALTEIWEAKLTAIQADMDALTQEIHSRIAAISQIEDE
ncbi:MAG: GTPase [Desulfatiglandaceae bacterium]